MSEYPRYIVPGLGTSRSLNYLLVVTTVVFIGTTAFLAMKNPLMKHVQ